MSRLSPWMEEDVTGMGLGNSQLPSLPEGNDLETPILAGNESYEWAAIPNLDIFFTRLYRYWACKGLRAMALAGVLNLAALAFTVGFSGFLLLGVNWPLLLTAECIEQETCDIIDVALYPHVLQSRGLAADVLLLTYLLIFGSYWAWSVVHFLSDIRDMVEIRHFVSNKLGCSDRRLSMMTWAELLHKLVMVQQTTRLCITRDLDEHAVVSRVMRKDNYLIAFINKGVLRLAPPPLAPTLTAALRGVAGCAAWALAAASTLTRRAAQIPEGAGEEQPQQVAGTHSSRNDAGTAPQHGACHGALDGAHSSVVMNGGARLRDCQMGVGAGSACDKGGVSRTVGVVKDFGEADSEQQLDSALGGSGPADGSASNAGINRTGDNVNGVQNCINQGEAARVDNYGVGTRAEEAQGTAPLLSGAYHSACSPTDISPHIDSGDASRTRQMERGRGRGPVWHWNRDARGHTQTLVGVAVVAVMWLVRHTLWLMAVVLGWGSKGLQRLSGSHASGPHSSSSWRSEGKEGGGSSTIGISSSNGFALLGGRRPLLTKTLEWNLRWCLLDHMFDEQFCVKRSFLEQPEILKKRFRTAALINAALSPFLLLFLLLYFFMRNAEHFYHHPGAAGSRRWSALARWRLRELNELPHYCSHRLDAAHAPACHYCAQFPSYSLASAARFVSFVVGSFTALLLLVTLLDEKLLERPLFGRHVVWWLATLGVVLTASRSFMNENPTAHDPERAMQEVVAHTHHLPRQWRGRAHTLEVQQAFNQLFQYKVLLFLEELASVILTPFMLFYTLPQCADDIVSFVSRFTTHVEGVGDICSLAAFNLQDHGNYKYGAPSTHVSKADKSRQGKMEKSFLTFVATYPTWEPGPAGKAMLLSLTQQQQGLTRPSSSPSMLHPIPLTSSSSPRPLPSFHATHRPLKLQTNSNFQRQHSAPQHAAPQCLAPHHGTFQHSPFQHPAPHQSVPEKHTSSFSSASQHSLHQHSTPQQHLPHAQLLQQQSSFVHHQEQPSHASSLHPHLQQQQQQQQQQCPPSHDGGVLHPAPLLSNSSAAAEHTARHLSGGDPDLPLCLDSEGEYQLTDATPQGTTDTQASGAETLGPVLVEHSLSGPHQAAAPAQQWTQQHLQLGSQEHVGLMQHHQPCHAHATDPHHTTPEMPAGPGSGLMPQALGETLLSHALQPDAAELCDDWDPQASAVHCSLFGAPLPVCSSSLLLEPPLVSGGSSLYAPQPHHYYPQHAHTQQSCVQHTLQPHTSQQLSYFQPNQTQQHHQQQPIGSSPPTNSLQGNIRTPSLSLSHDQHMNGTSGLGPGQHSSNSSSAFGLPHPPPGPTDSTELPHGGHEGVSNQGVMGPHTTPGSSSEHALDWTHVGTNAVPSGPAAPSQGAALQQQSPHCSIYVDQQGESSHMPHNTPRNHSSRMLTSSFRFGRSSKGSCAGFDTSSSLLLPTNEGQDLVQRLAAGHGALQNLYERTDHTVLHRYLGSGQLHRILNPGCAGVVPEQFTGPVRAASPGFDLH